MMAGGEIVKTKISPFGYQENREKIWQAIRQRQIFSVDQLEDATRINRDTIKSYLQGLQAAGYIKIKEAVKRTEKGNSYLSASYMLVNDVGVDAPKLDRKGNHITRGDARDHMWRTMKVLSTFTYRDLAIQASTQEITINEMDAKKYCNHLRKAGYLAIVKKGKPGGVLNVYQFMKSKNTGPKPPVIRQVTQVFDPNKDAVVFQSGGGQ